MKIERKQNTIYYEHFTDTFTSILPYKARKMSKNSWGTYLSWNSGYLCTQPFYPICQPKCLNIYIDSDLFWISGYLYTQPFYPTLYMTTKMSKYTPVTYLSWSNGYLSTQQFYPICQPKCLNIQQSLLYPELMVT